MSTTRKTKKKELRDDVISWRRDKVMQLSSRGFSQREIASTLQVANGTVARDSLILRDKAKDNIRNYIDERLPEEYEKCLVGLTAILKDAWNISQNTQENREKISALELAKSCYQTKLDLLTNATVLGDALKFVTSFTTTAANANEEETSDDIKQEESSNNKTINQVF